MKSLPITIFSAAMRGLMIGGPVAVPLMQAGAWIVWMSVVFGSRTVSRYRKRA
jgi:ABC-2 type transport system permease protein